MSLTMEQYERRVRWTRMADALASPTCSTCPAEAEHAFAARFGRAAAEAAFEVLLPGAGRELINWGY